MTEVVVCGEALIDMMPVGAGFEARNGGSPYNVAIGLSRLGTKSAFLGRLSQDRFGAQLAEGLARDGVFRDWVQMGAEPSTLAIVHPPRPGHPDVDYSFYLDNTASQSLSQAALPRGFGAAKHLHVGSFSLFREPSAGVVNGLIERESPNLSISLDPNIRASLIPERDKVANRIADLLPKIDLLRASDADLNWLYPGVAIEEICRSWLDRGVRIVVVTLGREGAVAYLRDGSLRVAAPKITLSDTVGAGDSFTAAILHSLCEQGRLGKLGMARLTAEEVERAMNFACKAAAIACSRVGADPPYARDMVPSLT